MSNAPHQYTPLNTWSPVGGAAGEVVESLGGGALIEEVDFPGTDAV